MNFHEKDGGVLLSSCGDERQALLVAGPSGAGKSTLIEHLKSGDLPDNIQREIPVGAADWPMIGPGHIRKRVRSRVPSPLPDASGVTVHYDTVYILRAKLDRYERDPAAEFFRNIESLVILYVRPDQERLLAQFAARVASRPNAGSLLHRLWARHIRKPINHALNRLSGVGNLRETEDIYRDRALVRYCYDEWERYMLSLIKGKKRARILHIEPMLDDLGNPAFRLAGKTAG